MPVHTVTLPNGGVGFQWGSHGAKYRDRESAERQARAAKANGADDENDSTRREVVSPPKGDDGLFKQPDDVSPAREVIEQHNRDRFAAHFKYADPYTGLTRTFDEAGDYNCGRCNQAEDGGCLLIKGLKIDRVAGSCGDWEIECAGDPEMTLGHKSVETAGYGVRKDGKPGNVFGCHVCPYASKATAPDSRGRDLYCGKGDFRAFRNACCVLNGAETL